MCFSAVPMTIKVGLTDGNQAKPLEYSEKKKSCISYHFIADALMYSHRPEYKARDKAEFILCTQTCQVSAATTVWHNKTLFIINCN